MEREFDEDMAYEVLAPVPYAGVRGEVLNDPLHLGRLNLLIEEWLLEKYQQTRSARTRETYDSILKQYRAALQQQGLDLDRQDCLAQLVSTARLFAAFSARGKEVAVATSNLRLAVLSSFYEFAIRNDLMSVNPIDKVRRGKTRRYQGAHAIEPEIVQARLRSIDTSTLDGKRDRALLLVYLQTCRRLSEVASLLWRDVQIDARPDARGTVEETLTLTFERCKGGKVMVDHLPAGISRVLLVWLRSYYGEHLAIAPTTPLWVALAPGGRNGKNQGHQLGHQAIADICKKYLGTSKVHTTRHSGTLARLKAGASVPDIRKQLGHESLATTDYYIEVLLHAPDAHATQVESMLL